MRAGGRAADQTVDILGVGISRLGLSAAVDLCIQRQASGGGGYVCFANAHSLTEAKRDGSIRKALTESFLSVADGVPVVWASRLKSAPIASRVCGPDFMLELVKRAGERSASRELTHGFIGGKAGQAEAVASSFGIGAISYSPPMREFSRENALEDWQNFLKLCPDGKAPAFVWIGLGAPKQELWMNAVSPCVSSASGTIFFGVGAAFDFWAGAKKRAPVWMQNNGLEWLFRLGQEPGRLWKRYLVGNACFVGHAVWEVVRGRK